MLRDGGLVRQFPHKFNEVRFLNYFMFNSMMDFYSDAAQGLNNSVPMDYGLCFVLYSFLYSTDPSKTRKQNGV